MSLRLDEVHLFALKVRIGANGSKMDECRRPSMGWWGKDGRNSPALNYDALDYAAVTGYIQPIGKERLHSIIPTVATFS